MDTWLLVILVLILIIVLCYVSSSAIKVLLSAGVLYLLYNYMFSKPQIHQIKHVEDTAECKSEKVVEDTELLKSVKNQVNQVKKSNANLSKGQMVALMERYTDDRRSIDEKMASKMAEKSTLDQRAIINNSKKTDASLKFIWDDELTAHENRVWWEQTDNFDLRM